MRGTLIAMGRPLSLGGLLLAETAEILPVVGRPMIQRYVELFADAGCEELTVVTGPGARPIEALLRDGTQWGVRIRYRRVDGTMEIDEVAADPLAAAPTILGRVVPGLADPEAYLRSVMATLSGSVEGFVPTGRETAPGVRVSHHVRIGKGVRLVPPVYIGEGAQIEAASVLGPFAVIENDAVVGQGSSVVRSVVLPNTMVGKSLDISDMIVRGDTFFKPSLCAAYKAEDPALSASK